MTNNFCQPDGICNEATDTVTGIVYVIGTSAPGLLKFIIVDFGTDCKGPTLFPSYPNRSGLVPMHLITAQWYTKPTKVGGNREENTRTTIPLILFWDWTIWKDQVQKI